AASSPHSATASRRAAPSLPCGEGLGWDPNSTDAGLEAAAPRMRSAPALSTARRAARGSPNGARSVLEITKASATAACRAAAAQQRRFAASEKAGENRRRHGVLSGRERHCAQLARLLRGDRFMHRLRRQARRRGGRSTTTVAIAGASRLASPYPK